MCGIVGIWNIRRSSVDAEILRRMTNTLVHRGPDAEGYWTEGGVGFGHRRLSIIDPSGSPQPMTIEHATVCFNGEIFNYKELREDLSKRGHGFTYAGDTEVILAQYLNHGIAGVEELNGQFAYAIYDSHNEELWLVRDRIGVMPLYYHFDGETLVFGSEIKALLPGLKRRPALDQAGLKEYLSYRSVPVPNTLFEGIRKLPPGQWLRLSRGGNLTTGVYWALPTEASDERISEREAIDELTVALEQAVKSRLVADVPVGAFLSGGVDSSLIVALMAELTANGGVETYSAGFNSPNSDELPFAKAVSEQYGTRHHEVTVPPDQLQSLWPKLTWHRDGPVSEPADVAVYQLSLKARETVKVLLSGEGSDELFAGYSKYSKRKLVGAADFIPTAIRRPLIWSMRRFLPYRIAIAMCAEPGAERTQAWRAPFSMAERDEMFGPATRHDFAEIYDRSSGDELQKMLYYDCHTWLVDNLLERGDRMAMAASVEFRPPFLDHRLVELAFRLPSRVKLKGGVTKWIVKEVARTKLPNSIVDRHKVGFRVPLNDWFRDDLKEFINDSLMSPNSFVRGFAGRERVQSILDDHWAGRLNEESRIWTMLSLEVWHQVFFGELATEYAA